MPGNFLYHYLINFPDTKVFGSTGSLGDDHFVRYSRKSVISNSGTSENLCTRSLSLLNGAAGLFVCGYVHEHSNPIITNPNKPNSPL